MRDEPGVCGVVAGERNLPRGVPADCRRVVALAWRVARCCRGESPFCRSTVPNTPGGSRLCSVRAGYCAFHGRNWGRAPWLCSGIAGMDHCRRRSRPAAERGREAAGCSMQPERRSRFPSSRYPSPAIAGKFCGWGSGAARCFPLPPMGGVYSRHTLGGGGNSERHGPPPPQGLPGMVGGGGHAALGASCTHDAP